MDYPKEYNKKNLFLTHIPKGEKGPKHNGWNKNPTPHDHWSNGNADDNVGLLHKLSGTCCLDVDDLEMAKKYGMFDIKGEHPLDEIGICWKSGKPNRLKILFRIKPKYKGKLETFKLIYGKHHLGEFNTTMDVLPPSLHPEGYQYEWIDKLPKKIPYLPDRLSEILLERQNKAKKRKKRTRGGFIQETIKFLEDKGYDTGTEIEKTGQYEPALHGFKRIDSTSVVSIYEHHDGWNNYSTTEGDGLFQHGPVDLYDCLVMNEYNGDYDRAKKEICNGTYNKELKLKIDKLDNTPTYEHTEETGEFVAGNITEKKKAKFDPAELNFKGILKELEQYIYDQSYYPNVMGSHIGALSLMSFFCANRYKMSDGLRTPTYFVVVGDSGEGKEPFVTIPSKIIWSVSDKPNLKDKSLENFAGMVITPKGSTIEGVQDDFKLTLPRRPDLYCPWDEYGKFNKEAQNNANKGSLKNLLLDAYTQKDQTKGKRSRQKSGPVTMLDLSMGRMVKPSITLIAATTSTSLRQGILDDDIWSGFANRHMFIMIGDYWQKHRRDLIKKTVPDSITKKLIKCTQLPKKYRESTYNFIDALKYRDTEAIIVDITPQARDHVDDYQDDVDRMKDKFRLICNKRNAENAKKIAMILAISKNTKSPLIELGMMQRAIKFVEHSSGNAITLFEGRLSESTDNRGQKILDTQDEILALCKRFCKHGAAISFSSLANSITRLRNGSLNAEQERERFLEQNEDVYESGEMRKDRFTNYAGNRPMRFIYKRGAHVRKVRNLKKGVKGEITTDAEYICKKEEISE